MCLSVIISIAGNNIKIMSRSKSRRSQGDPCCPCLDVSDIEWIISEEDVCAFEWRIFLCICYWHSYLKLRWGIQNKCVGDWNKYTKNTLISCLDVDNMMHICVRIAFGKRSILQVCKANIKIIFNKQDWVFPFNVGSILSNKFSFH